MPSTPVLEEKWIVRGTLLPFMFPKRAFLTTLAVLIGFCVPTQGQRGALVKPKSLNEMTAQADRVIHAYVVAAKVEPHPRYRNISTVVVTLAVQETLKGETPKQFTIREFIWDLRDQMDAAAFRKGKDVVLFLNKENQEGLTGTIGADQGRFDVAHEMDGRITVRAHAPNRVLLQGTQEALAKKNRTLPASLRGALIDPAGRMDLAEFKSVIRDLVGTRGGK